MRTFFLLFAIVLPPAPLAMAGPGSAITLNLEPTPDNPRNSEGSFIALKSGRIAFYYSEFYGGLADYASARIVGIHSDDNGRTWSKPRIIVEKGDALNVMSVSMLRLGDGRIAMFYVVKNSGLDSGPWMRTSEDEGVTWSEARRVVGAPGYFVLNNDRIIRTSKGRIIVPVAFNRAKKREPGGTPGTEHINDIRGIAMWFFSDDEGATWKEAGSWWAMPRHSRRGLQEPGVVELANGRLFSWVRTDQGAQYGFHSRDGNVWSPPEPTSMMSPVSPASIKRLPGSDALLAIYNDHAGRFPFPKGKRTPLVAAISSDNGETWPSAKIIEDDPDGWFCYTAIHYTDDNGILLAYCAGDSKVGRLARLRIRRIERSWLPPIPEATQSVAGSE